MYTLALLVKVLITQRLYFREKTGRHMISVFFCDSTTLYKKENQLGKTLTSCLLTADVSLRIFWNEDTEDDGGVKAALELLLVILEFASVFANGVYVIAKSGGVEIGK